MRIGVLGTGMVGHAIGNKRLDDLCAREGGLDLLAERVRVADGEGGRHFRLRNRVNCEIMVDPTKVPGAHDIFVCGEDEGAKRRVGELLESFGWPAERIIDLGGIRFARGSEMYLPLWLSLWGRLGTGYFNISVVRAEA